jgi:hypothetical protein
MDFGIPGVAFEPGDHIWAVYVGGQERDEVLLAYLREGVRGSDNSAASARGSSWTC